jgi:hypothetical protein
MASCGKINSGLLELGIAVVRLSLLGLMWDDNRSKVEFADLPFWTTLYGEITSGRNLHLPEGMCDPGWQHMYKKQGSPA